MARRARRAPAAAAAVRLVARALAPACDEIVLSVAPANEAAPDFEKALYEAVRSAGARPTALARDEAAHRGPVGGLAAALRVARGLFAFVASCDAPLLAPTLVEGLLERAESDPTLDVVLPIWEERPEPLLAVYRVSTMGPHFAERLAMGRARVQDGFDACRVLRVDDEALRRFDPGGGSFLNLNHPADLEEARARFAAHEPRTTGD